MPFVRRLVCSLGVVARDRSEAAAFSFPYLGHIFCRERVYVSLAYLPSQATYKMILVD